MLHPIPVMQKDPSKSMAVLRAEVQRMIENTLPVGSVLVAITPMHPASMLIAGIELNNGKATHASLSAGKRLLRVLSEKHKPETLTPGRLKTSSP